MTHRKCITIRNKETDDTSVTSPDKLNVNNKVKYE